MSEAIEQLGLDAAAVWEVTTAIEVAIDSISRRPHPPAAEAEAKQTMLTLTQLRDWARRAHAAIVDKRDGFIRAVEELRAQDLSEEQAARLVDEGTVPVKRDFK